MSPITDNGGIMKYLLVVVLLVVPVTSFATPADSMLGPFKLPFHIGVKVNGDFRWSAGAGEVPVPKSFGETVDIGAIGTHVTVHLLDQTGRHGVDTAETVVLGDTMRYRHWSIDTTQGNSELIVEYLREGFDIMLDTIRHSVLTIRFWHSSSGGGHTFYDNTSWSVNLSNFAYTSDSIFSSDTALEVHLDTAYYAAQGKTQNDPIYQYWVWLDTTTSVDLSGIFATTKLGQSIVISEPTSSTFAINESNGAVVCTFDAAPRSRTLEVYSLLGQRVAAVPVAVGEDHATIRLPDGLFFLRLDGKTIKVQISN
jgi:hypothetical protein